jgi:RNA polymerase sigma factor (sigma-70 family)
MTENEFAELFHNTKGIVLSAIQKNLNNNLFSYIDDVVQETYLRAYKSLSKGKLLDFSKVNSWLYIIAKNESLRMNLKFSREKKIISEFTEKLIIERQIDENEGKIRSHQQQLIFEKSKFLPKKYLDVFRLFSKGKSEKNISNILNIPQGTVKSRLHRAKKYLEKIVKKSIL